MIMFELSQSFSFDAAHTLVRQVPQEEKLSSQRIHGHTFHAEVFIKSPKLCDGYVVDLFEMRSQIDKVKKMLDHQFLDNVEGLGGGTLENLCVFIFRHVCLPVSKVSVWRSSGDRCTYCVTQ